MLYQRNRARELTPMGEPNWHARRFVGNELLDIMNLLRNLIQLKCHKFPMKSMTKM